MKLNNYTKRIKELLNVISDENDIALYYICSDIYEKGFMEGVDVCQKIVKCSKETMKEMEEKNE